MKNMKYEQWYQLTSEIVASMYLDMNALAEIGNPIMEKENKGEDVVEEWITWEEELRSFFLPALKRRLSIHAQELDRLSTLTIEFDKHIANSRMPGGQLQLELHPELQSPWAPIHQDVNKS